MSDFEDDLMEDDDEYDLVSACSITVIYVSSSLMYL